MIRFTTVLQWRQYSYMNSVSIVALLKWNRVAIKFQVVPSFKETNIKNRRYRKVNIHSFLFRMFRFVSKLSFAHFMQENTIRGDQVGKLKYSIFIVQMSRFVKNGIIWEIIISVRVVQKIIWVSRDGKKFVNCATNLLKPRLGSIHNIWMVKLESFCKLNLHFDTWMSCHVLSYAV